MNVMLSYFLDQFRDGDINDIEYRKKLIDTFIYKVYVYDDKLLIIYNYTNRETQVNEEELIDYVEGEGSDIEASAPPPRRRKRHIACGDFFTKVTVRSFCCVSLFAKRHAALPPFCECAPAAHFYFIIRFASFLSRKTNRINIYVILHSVYMVPWRIRSRQ